MLTDCCALENTLNLKDVNEQYVHKASLEFLVACLCSTGAFYGGTQYTVRKARVVSS